MYVHNTHVHSLLLPRQNITTNPNDPSDYDPTSWWSIVIKWAVLVGIVVVIALILLSTCMSARTRALKGLPPRMLERWIIPKAKFTKWAAAAPPPATAAQRPRRAYSSYDSYAMHPYQAPPPAYNPETDYVPAYAPPEPNSKFAKTGAADATSVSSPSSSSPNPPPPPPPTGPPPAWEAASPAAAGGPSRPA